MKFQVAISLLLLAIAAEICCMTDFLKAEDFNPVNGTDLTPNLSTFSNKRPHTETHTAISDEYHTQSGDVLPWFQNNVRPKENHSSENIYHEDTNLGSGMPGNVNFKPSPYDSRITGHDINRNLPNEQWLNNFYNQRYFPTDIPHHDNHYPSHGHEQNQHHFHTPKNSWKPGNFGSHHSISNHNSVTPHPLKSNHLSPSYNNDIYHRLGSPKYDGHHPAMHHQKQNSHNVNNYHKLNTFIGGNHHTGKDFHPYNSKFRNAHPTHIERDINTGHNPLNFEGSYHQVESGHDNFEGMAHFDAERFPFESMLTKEDLESLIFYFYEPGNSFMTNGGDILSDRIQYSGKRSAGSNHGFKYFLDKFITKTESIVSKWGPKIEKVGDAVGLVFGFLKYVSNLPVFHLQH